MAAILPAVCSVIPVSPEVDFGSLPTNLLLGFLCMCLYIPRLSLQIIINLIIQFVFFFNNPHNFLRKNGESVSALSGVFMISLSMESLHKQVWQNLLFAARDPGSFLHAGCKAL